MFGTKATFPEKGEAIDHSQLQRLERLSRKAMLSQAKRLDPIAFEHMVGALFERMGYEVRTTVASGDQGVDLYVRQGRRTAVVQCKRYRGDVGSPLVRDLYGTMLHNNADEAFMVTTGNISNQARQWAEGKSIQLIDGFALVEWISTLDQHGRTRRRGWLLAGMAVAVLAVAFVATRGGLPAALGALSSINLPTFPQVADLPADDPTTVPPTATVEIIPTVADADPAVVPPPTSAPIDPPSSTQEPMPEMPTPLTFTEKERGFAFTYDSRWQPEKAESPGRAAGITVRLTQQGYTFQIQAQDLPFAVPFCPTPTAQELERDFRRVMVNGVVMWRPAVESGVVAQAADGTILPLSVMTAATENDGRAAQADYLCAFPAGRGYLAVSYLLPSDLARPTQADPEMLAQMDTILQSLVWEAPPVTR